MPTNEIMVEVLVIIGLIILNGIFSMSEMALVASKKFKLEKARKKGSNGALVALKLAENPTYFLSTIQIGITLIGILLGISSGDNLTKNLTNFIAQYTILAPYALEIAIGLIVIIITFLSIVLGELFPKRLGMAYPEKIAILIAKPIKILSIITRPFVSLLAITNDLILALLQIKNRDNQAVTEEEIKSIIRDSADSGEIQNIEQDIVQRVFELGDRKVNTLFTHRSAIIFFNSNESVETIKMKIKLEKHAAYPVCKSGNIDNVIGIVTIKNLITELSEFNFKLINHIQKAIFINENMSAYNVLELFKKERMHYGIVVDEFGMTLGIVTMDDLVDALFGDVTELGQVEYKITKRDDVSWFIDAQLAVAEFAKYFDLEIIHHDKFTTVAGFFIHKFGGLPEIGDKIIVDNFSLEVLDKDGQRIDKLLICKID